MASKKDDEQEALNKRVVERFKAATTTGDLGEKFGDKYGIEKIAESVAETMPRFVYKGVNEAKKEIYYGVSKEPVERILDGHYGGDTKAIDHWAFGKDEIKWSIMSKHEDQESASKEGHRLEEIPVKGYKVIRTSGI